MPPSHTRYTSTAYVLVRNYATKFWGMSETRTIKMAAQRFSSFFHVGIKNRLNFIVGKWSPGNPGRLSSLEKRGVRILCNYTNTFLAGRSPSLPKSSSASIRNSTVFSTYKICLPNVPTSHSKNHTSHI